MKKTLLPPGFFDGGFDPLKVSDLFFLAEPALPAKSDVLCLVAAATALFRPLTRQ